VNNIRIKQDKTRKVVATRAPSAKVYRNKVKLRKIRRGVDGATRPTTVYHQDQI